MMAQPTPVRRATLDEIAVVRGGWIPNTNESWERARLEDELRARSTNEVESPFSQRALQPNAVQQDGGIDWNELSAILPVRNAERFAIRDGDLLLPLRSARIQATVAREVPGSVIAAGQWALITPHEHDADVDYLCWYLNHPRTRSRLADSMKGSSLQFLTLRSVKEFEVQLPTNNIQVNIGRVAKLKTRVGHLERQLEHLRRQLTDGLAMSLVENPRT